MSTPASPAGPTAAESGSGPDEAGLDGLAAAEDALAAEADRAHEDNASLVRSSGVMAVGTLVSRVTGFLRTAVFGYALGAAALANAYNNANTLPNVVYNLALGGILTSVDRAAARQRGQAGHRPAARPTTSGCSRWSSLALLGITRGRDAGWPDPWSHLYSGLRARLRAVTSW